MTSPFMVKLTEAERATLESERARLGLRSMAEVIRHWIANAPLTRIAWPAEDKPGGITYIERSALEAAARAAAKRLVPLTNAKGEPRELPKPRDEFKSRLKGHWKPR